MEYVSEGEGLMVHVRGISVHVPHVINPFKKKTLILINNGNSNNNNNNNDDLINE